MADLSHQEQVERRLRDELDEAERRLQEAPAHERSGARLRYRYAIQRFSRFVVDGILAEE